MHKINVITLFSGYDSQCLALNRLGIDYELIAWADIDKYAVKAHNALFPQWADGNLGDVSNVDWTSIKGSVDLLTYSSPCTDFSMAGRMAGGDEGSGTRSSLLWEVEKAISVLKPKYLLFENVAALVSNKFISVFNKWQQRLQTYGYTNFVQVMNAKDYGCPQNRRRVFMVSIHNCDTSYVFPQVVSLKKHVNDCLECDVDLRYYLDDNRVQQFLSNIVQSRSKSPIQVLGWTRDKKGRVVDYHAVSVANCVTANKRDNTQNYVLEQIFLNGDKDGNASTVTTTHDFAGNITNPQGGHKQMGVAEITSDSQDNIRVRRLTERELYRLMDVDEKDIDILLDTDIPKTQHAKLAGNSIVVGCLYYIFRNLFTDTSEKEQQLKLF